MDSNQINNIQSVGSRVEALRILHNETKASLALVVGVSEQYLGQLLKDRYRWSEEKAMSAALHYNVSFDYVYYGILDGSAADYRMNYVDQEISGMHTGNTGMSREEKKAWVERILLLLVDILTDDPFWRE